MKKTLLTCNHFTDIYLNFQWEMTLNWINVSEKGRKSMVSFDFLPYFRKVNCITYLPPFIIIEDLRIYRVFFHSFLQLLWVPRRTGTDHKVSDRSPGLGAGDSNNSPLLWHQASTFISEGRFWQSLIWSAHCCINMFFFSIFII